MTSILLQQTGGSVGSSLREIMPIALLVLMIIEYELIRAGQARLASTRLKRTQALILPLFAGFAILMLARLYTIIQ